MSFRVIVKTGYTCNNNCIFCHARFKRKCADLTLSEIKHKILMAKRIQADMIILSGGEPTIRRDIFAIAEFVKANKMALGLITNGRMLSYNPFFNKLRKNGLKFVYVSLHGNKKINNFLTRSDGFYQTLNGISNASKSDVELIVNCVVTKYNMEFLDKLIDTLKIYRIDKIKFSFDEPSTEEDCGLISPYIVDAAYFVKKAIDYGIKSGIEMGFDGFPLCIMGGYEHHLDNLKTNKIHFISECYDDSFFPCDSGTKIKFKFCKKCHKNDECEGVYKLYYNFEFGKLGNTHFIINRNDFIQILSDWYKLEPGIEYDKFVKSLLILSECGFPRAKCGTDKLDKMLNFHDLEFSMLLDTNSKYLRFHFFCKPKNIIRIKRAVMKIYNEYYDTHLFEMVAGLAEKYNITTNLGFEYKEKEPPIIKIYFNNDRGEFSKFLLEIEKVLHLDLKRVVGNLSFYMMGLSFFPDGKCLQKYYFYLNDTKRVVSKYLYFIQKNTLKGLRKHSSKDVLAFKFFGNELKDILYHDKILGDCDKKLIQYDNCIDFLRIFFNKYDKEVVPICVMQSVLKSCENRCSRLYFKIRPKMQSNPTLIGGECGNMQSLWDFSLEG